MCIFALARTTSNTSISTSTSCELLQNVYLCISTYNIKILFYAFIDVVNCFKMCIFALARTTKKLEKKKKICCELLQNVYLCISTYNLFALYDKSLYVVNCFKMCIFALARTTVINQMTVQICCELLQNVYLCISTYNLDDIYSTSDTVVNCFKMCIFALARTTLYHF